MNADTASKFEQEVAALSNVVQRLRFKYAAVAASDEDNATLLPVFIALSDAEKQLRAADSRLCIFVLQKG